MIDNNQPSHSLPTRKVSISDASQFLR